MWLWFTCPASHLCQASPCHSETAPLWLHVLFPMAAYSQWLRQVWYQTQAVLAPSETAVMWWALMSLRSHQAAEPASQPGCAEHMPRSYFPLLPFPGVGSSSTSWTPDFHSALLSFSRSVVEDSLQPHGQQQPGSSFLHYLPEFAQTHVHWVGDAVEPSHLLSTASQTQICYTDLHPFPVSPHFTRILFSPPRARDLLLSQMSM